MNIRDASPKDAVLLTELIRSSFNDVARRYNLTPENCPKHPSNCRADWIEWAMDKGVQYYLLEEDGRAKGCAALEKASPETCYLERLAVLPEFRRKGLGRRLVDHALDQAKNLGVSKVEIGLIDWQTDLKQWYAGLGFSNKNTAEFEHLPFPVAFMFIEL